MSKWQNQAYALHNQTGMPLVDAMQECFDSDEAGFEIDEDFETRLAQVHYTVEMMDIKIEGHTIRCDHTGENVYAYLDNYKKPAVSIACKQWAANIIEEFVLRNWL